MKKMLMIAFVAMATVFCFTSCSKEKELKGTTWAASMTYSMTQEIEGETYTIDWLGDFVLAFTDETNGTLTFTLTASMGGIPLRSQSDSGEFTYTFDGESGVMTSDGEPQSFTYNEKDNTIVIIGSIDEELDVTLVFTETTK